MITVKYQFIFIHEKLNDFDIELSVHYLISFSSKNCFALLLVILISEFFGKLWHGESDVASWTATGDNKPMGVSPFHPRDYSSMFDDDLTTYWVGDYSDTDGSVSVQNTVVVTFVGEVEFHALQIVTRPDCPECFDGTYQSMCLVLDDGTSGQYCTAADLVVGVSEVIVLGPASPITVTKVELRFATGEVAQVADFTIQYKGTAKFF